MCMHLKWHKHVQTLTSTHPHIHTQLLRIVFASLWTPQNIYLCYNFYLYLLGIFSIRSTSVRFHIVIFHRSGVCFFLCMRSIPSFILLHTKMVNRLPCQIGFMLTTHWPKTLEQKKNQPSILGNLRSTPHCVKGVNQTGVRTIVIFIKMLSQTNEPLLMYHKPIQ